MTPMTMTKEDFAGLGAPDLVYVREIKASDLLDEAVQMKDVEIDPGQSLYAVHSADGERLAVMIDRDTAFAAAVAHELEPVSVH
ncbi:hypothetical protein SH203_01805 [Brevundimonas sp. SH203]|uniref:DUF1150 family protein n=1 Tax=Brevundimonas sp. SH203 TaxID=345167 RepID=UPI0009CDC460|nr:DUF1150 domain-containing protein [Brevundimonas sp. SH203]GAW41400.1 hypothetical protein SH203_01805 [Brevundimonas sp. SH203]